MRRAYIARARLNTTICANAHTGFVALNALSFIARSLLATARRHRDLAPRLRDLASQTAATKRALVHGDTSPKNVLVGPNGPAAPSTLR